jgi:hypothetical protein
VKTVLLLAEPVQIFRQFSREPTAIVLAREIHLDPDLLLAMAGKVSSELQTIIRKRPKLFAELRALKDQPDHAVLRIVREVRDGDW